MMGEDVQERAHYNGGGEDPSHPLLGETFLPVKVTDEETQSNGLTDSIRREMRVY